MFDLCSSDNWVTQSTLKTIQFNYLQPFNGLAKTMNGTKHMILPRVEVRVQLDATLLRIVCLVVPGIGVKAPIESNRFQRLVKSFNMEPHQFDTSSGPIGLLIGMAQQRYGTNRIGEFISSEFPQVGIYTSPLLSQGAFLFVGVITEAVATYSTEVQTIQTEVFHTSSFGIEKDLHNFLEAEKAINLVDLKCTACLLKDNCASPC